jgi:hypothetical protein
MQQFLHEIYNNFASKQACIMLSSTPHRMYYSAKQKGAITTTIIILKQDQAPPPLATPPLAVAPPQLVLATVGPPRANAAATRLRCKISMYVKFHHSFVNPSINDGSIIIVFSPRR